MSTDITPEMVAVLNKDFLVKGATARECIRRIFEMAEKQKPETPVVTPKGPHPSHNTRFSDSSMYDEVCTLCGATDVTGGGWGRLAFPCTEVKS